MQQIGCNSVGEGLSCRKLSVSQSWSRLGPPGCSLRVNKTIPDALGALAFVQQVQLVDIGLINLLDSHISLQLDLMLSRAFCGPALVVVNIIDHVPPGSSVLVRVGPGERGNTTNLQSDMCSHSFG